MKTKEPQSVKRKYSGKMLKKKTMRKKLVTVDSSEKET
jgi:hypothetical protein